MTALLQADGLVKHFVTTGGIFGRPSVVHAVDGVDLVIGQGEVFAVVGESGCGKSTLARLVLRLIEPTAGRIRFDGRDLLAADGRTLRELRRRIQIIFQDPFASLNPRMRVFDAVAEPLRIHRVAQGADLATRVNGLLEQVGLSRDAGGRYPHEFSGGQKQRICIARALALKPRLLVADEPVSALDVSIQAQILNLLEDLKAEYDLSYLFITHDMHVVRHFADRVAVMYLGVIMESTTTETLFAGSLHPYTEALLSAVPEPDASRRRNRIVLSGDVPSPIRIPPGCRFHPRCPKRFEPCDRLAPTLIETRPGHRVACHLANPP